MNITTIEKLPLPDVHTTLKRLYCYFQINYNFPALYKRKLNFKQLKREFPSEMMEAEQRGSRDVKMSFFEFIFLFIFPS
jgi:hypothetical protein